MNERRFRFAIHGFLMIDIDDRRGWFNRLVGIYHRYMAYQTPRDRSADPDMTVVLGRFDPDLADCHIVDEHFYVKRNYLYVRNEKSKLGGELRFDAAGLEEGPITLRIDSNLMASPFVAGRIIDFFISYLLTKKGYSLIHASGISKNGLCTAFSARGGGGKTSVAVHAVHAHDYSYLGDNFLIIKQGIIWGFLSDLNLFGYNINQRIWNQLSAIEKARYRLVMSVYRLTRGYVKIFLPISPLRFFGDSLEKTARLKTFCSMLAQGTQVRKESLLKATALKRTLFNHRLEFPFFARYIDEYRCVFLDSHFSNYWSEYEAALAGNLGEGIDFVQITIPSKLDRAALEQMLNMAGA